MWYVDKCVAKLCQPDRQAGSTLANDKANVALGKLQRINWKRSYRGARCLATTPHCPRRHVRNNRIPSLIVAVGQRPQQPHNRLALTDISKIIYRLFSHWKRYYRHVLRCTMRSCRSTNRTAETIIPVAVSVYVYTRNHQVLTVYMHAEPTSSCNATFPSYPRRHTSEIQLRQLLPCQMRWRTSKEAPSYSICLGSRAECICCYKELGYVAR
jgi:hypothetical protein